jgi:flagellar basal-body rod modification protein FlgD
MTPAIDSSNSAGAAQSGTSNSNVQKKNGIDNLANEQTFLQLLVAQLKNQDPLSPADGLQFVQQLAQFSSLEQQLQMRQDLDTITGVISNSQTGGAKNDRNS